MPNNGGGSGSPAAEHWRRFVLSYVAGVQKEAQEFQVKRARKMRETEKEKAEKEKAKKANDTYVNNRVYIDNHLQARTVPYRINISLYK